ncbi:hypothetical protein SAZ11_40135 [Streptomyces sp. FXJ1.4098]|nr:hypothetical protein [Streptomyces sp. FXJ1.4098]
MSNIFTDAIRVYARPGDRIDAVEAQWITWILLGRRGSYHVPVLIRREPEGLTSTSSTARARAPTS